MAAGASVRSRRWLDRVRAWLGHHRAVALESLATLLKNWLTSTMTWLAIGIALALPVILYLILVNVGNLSGEWEGKPGITLYLSDSVSSADGKAFANAIEDREIVESTRYVSAKEALDEFQGMSGFGEVVDSLDHNPLPAVILVAPAVSEPARLKLLITALEGESRVARASMDLKWIERLYAIIAFGQRLVAALGAFLALGVLLIIGNTIRLAIENRRDEIEVVKLVGGTDAFVRRPFLYLGLWYGLGGAIIAWLLVQISLMFLAAPVQRLVQSYGNQFSISGLGVTESLVLWTAGSILGVMGAILAVSRHLHEIEPS